VSDKARSSEEPYSPDLSCYRRIFMLRPNRNTLVNIVRQVVIHMYGNATLRPVKDFHSCCRCVVDFTSPELPILKHRDQGASVGESKAVFLWSIRLIPIVISRSLPRAPTQKAFPIHQYSNGRHCRRFGAVGCVEEPSVLTS